MKALLFFCLLFCVHAATAQVRVGIFGGGQFTFLRSNRDLGVTSKGALTPAGGVMAHFRIEKLSFMETGLNLGAVFASRFRQLF
jgi:hypothetical protein